MTKRYKKLLIKRNENKKGKGKREKKIKKKN